VIVFTAADNNYSLQAAVLVKSLCISQSRKTLLIIFGNDWSRKQISFIQSLSNDLVTVDVRSVNAEDFTNVRLSRGFPLATAYNVLAPEYLLRNESRAIYMDADMVVTEDLGPLWDIQLSTAVGAVLDAHIVWASSPSMWRPWREEALPPLTPYLNTGLMLIDLAKWRNQKLTERTLNFLTKYELPCVDQDALNLALRGDFDQIHPRYNSMPYHHLKMLRYLDTVESDEIIGQAITNPAVIHFHRSFLGKPWTYGCRHPGSDLWRSLADEVRPRWRKHFDFIGLARNFAAKKAKMTTLDERSFIYPIDTLIRKRNS
jgi:lipopolysaccharide biosynthesis glycosyltransferase